MLSFLDTDSSSFGDRMQKKTLISDQQSAYEFIKLESVILFGAQPRFDVRLP